MAADPRDTVLTWLPEDWRFTRIDVASKRAFMKDWPTTPLPASEVDLAQHGMGLLLGPLSGGTMAIDFDGTEGVEFFEQHIMPISQLPNAPMWSSGKMDRFQVAFRVPEEAWPIVRSHNDAQVSIQLVSGQTKTIKRLELRWSGRQSVLPPSRHPETGRYVWLTEPTPSNAQAELPYGVLEWWVKRTHREAPAETMERQPLSDAQLEDTLRRLKRYYPAPDYETWRTIAHALYCEIGGQAKPAMLALWPETRAGEYSSLFSSIDRSLSPKAGSLIWLVRKHEPDYLKSDERKRDELKAKLRVLKRAKR